MYETFGQKWPSFYKEILSAYRNSFGEMYFFRGELQIDAKNLNFENFQSALYMKSGSMPLSMRGSWCQCSMLRLLY